MLSMPPKKKPVLLPTSDMSDVEILELFDKRYPKTHRKISINYLERNDNPLYFELKKRKLLLTAMHHERPGEK